MTIVVTLFLACLFAMTTGCVSTDDIQAQITAMQDRLSQEGVHIADLTARLDALPEPGTGTPQEEAARLAIEAAIEESRLRAQAYETAIANGELYLSEANDFSQTPIGVLATSAPEPYRSLFLLGGGIAGMVWQRRRVTRAATVIVQSLEQAKTLDPAMRESFATNAATIIKAQAADPLAVKIVAKAKGKKETKES